MKKLALLGLLSLIAVAGPANAAKPPKAPPPKPPQATTGAATAISQTAATLNGSVNPRGLSTTYHFDYGTTNAYGHSTAVLSAGSGTTAQAVSARITGLLAGTTYHFRLVASNSAGTTLGKDSHFATLPRLTLGAKPRPIVYGGSTTLSGRLQSPNNAGKSIALQSNPYPYKGFVTVATTTTDSLGRYSFVRHPGSITRYRTTTVKGTTLTSGVVQVGVRIRLTAQASDTTPAKGQHVRFTGFACPAHVGRLVSLQRRNSKGVWVTVKQTHLVKTTSSLTCKTRSRYTVGIDVNRNGTFRTVASADHDHRAGISPRIVVTVH